MDRTVGASSIAVGLNSPGGSRRSCNGLASGRWVSVVRVTLGDAAVPGAFGAAQAEDANACSYLGAALTDPHLLCRPAAAARPDRRAAVR
ncbi:MAG: hypothetical protein ACLPVY_28040 [Acidimicrobiia bacterium]